MLIRLGGFVLILAPDHVLEQEGKGKQSRVDICNGEMKEGSEQRSTLYLIVIRLWHISIKSTNLPSNDARVSLHRLENAHSIIGKVETNDKASRLVLFVLIHQLGAEAKCPASGINIKDVSQNV